MDREGGLSFKYKKVHRSISQSETDKVQPGIKKGFGRLAQSGYIKVRAC